MPGNNNIYEGKAALKRAEEIIGYLKELYPRAVCALEFDGEPWKLMVMGRLSAQCTDKRVNEVCRELFRVFPTFFDLADGDIEEIQKIIRPCGLFRVKSEDIKNECIMLRDRFGGQLPDTMEELLCFPGVGRKIANLLLGDVWGKGGIVADTHCIRICGRLGFYQEGQKDPLKTERIMSALIPTDEQSDFCHRIVNFGREYCRAQSPLCSECPLAYVCFSDAKK